VFNEHTPTKTYGGVVVRRYTVLKIWSRAAVVDSKLRQYCQYQVFFHSQVRVPSASEKGVIIFTNRPPYSVENPYSTTGCTAFENSTNHLKILGTRKVTWGKFHTEQPQTLGATVQNTVVQTPCRPGFVYYWCYLLDRRLRRYEGWSAVLPPAGIKIQAYVHENNQPHTPAGSVSVSGHTFKRTREHRLLAEISCQQSALPPPRGGPIMKSCHPKNVMR
jgi:hypothetical protein